jgi:hypothetical protein
MLNFGVQLGIHMFSMCAVALQTDPRAPPSPIRSIICPRVAMQTNFCLDDLWIASIWCVCASPRTQKTKGNIKFSLTILTKGNIEST